MISRSSSAAWRPTRVRARAQPLWRCSQLQLQLAAVLDRLRVGVGGIFHAVHAAVDHVRDRAAAAGAAPLTTLMTAFEPSFNQFEMRHVHVLGLLVMCGRVAVAARRASSSFPASPVVRSPVRTVRTPR